MSVQQIGKRIRLVRKKLGLTQEEFARPLNISRSHLSGMESGRQPITDRTVMAICTQYGVKRAWLESGEGEMEGRAGIAGNMAILEQLADSQGRDVKFLLASLKAKSDMFDKLIDLLGPDIEILTTFKHGDADLIEFLEEKIHEHEKLPTPDPAESRKLKLEMIKRFLLEPDPYDIDMAEGDLDLATLIRKIRIIFTWGDIDEIEGYLTSLADFTIQQKLEQESSTTRRSG